MRRGFFRLWVFLSVLWAGAVIIYLEPHSDWRSYRTGQALLSGSESPTEAVQLAIKARAKRDGITEIEVMEQLRDAKLKDLWDYVFATTVPPVGLLLLGLSVGWVVAGFKRP